MHCNQSNYTKIGQLSKVRGNLGAFKALINTSHPKYYLSFTFVYLKKKDQDSVQKLSVEQFSVVNSYFVLKLNEIDSYEKAEEWLDADIMVEDTDLKPLDENEYFIHALIGSKVYNDQGDFFGTICHYFENGAHGVCEIADQNRQFLLPMIDEFIISVDQENKRVVAQVEHFID